LKRLGKIVTGSCICAITLIILATDFSMLNTNIHSVRAVETIYPSTTNLLNEWLYRKAHNITGSTAGTQTNYQMMVHVHYGDGIDGGANVYLSGNCKIDFGDIRFTDSTGITTLDYWIEQKVDSVSAIFWVEVDNIPMFPENTTIYIYYGNDGASTTSNGDDTFTVFHDFEDGTTEDLIVTVGAFEAYYEGGTHGYVLRQTDLSEWNRMAYWTEDVLSDDICIEGDMKRGDATSGSGIAVVLRKPDGRGGYLFTYKHDHRIAIKHFDDWDDPKTYTPFPAADKVSDAEWHKMKIVRNSSGYMEFRLDNTSLTTTHLAFFGPWNIAVWCGDSLHKWDNLRVRKLVDPEPQHTSWGISSHIWVDLPVREVGIGHNFTALINITNVENLYGLDLRLQWNATLLDYVNHTATIPIESHIGGVLHEPVFEFKNEVNETNGTYWVAYTSSSPAPPFSGSGSVFEITFQAIAGGNCSLTVFGSELSDFDGNPISHSVINGSVNIRDFHDVAVTGISLAKNIVGQGQSCEINVTIANLGTLPGDFNVTLFANGTTIDTDSISLGYDISGTMIFVWNTTGWSKGNYTISAYATPVPGETSTEDNSHTNGWIFVSIPGDVDGDRDVDIFDAVKVTRIYGSELGDPQYTPNEDIDNDGQITIFDVVILASHYGEEDL